MLNRVFWTGRIPRKLHHVTIFSEVRGKLLISRTEAKVIFVKNDNVKNMLFLWMLETIPMGHVCVGK